MKTQNNPNRTFKGMATQPRKTLIVEWSEGTSDKTQQKTLSLQESLKIANHSPTGFNWGYAGSGPAQTAIAILWEVTQDTEITTRHYQEFKTMFIATLPSQDVNWFIYESVILRWLELVTAGQEFNPARHIHTGEIGIIT